MKRKRAPKREVVMPEGSNERNAMSRTSAFGFGACQLPLTIVPSFKSPKGDLRFSVFFLKPFVLLGVIEGCVFVRVA
jgi:hypothetical protein